MDIPSDEDAWGEFKSTTEQGDSVGAVSTIAGSEFNEHDEPPPSVVHHHHHQPQAEEPASAAGGGKEDDHGSADTATPARPAVPSPAAELREGSNQGMMAVKAAQSPEHKQQPHSHDDDTSGSGVDLLNLLPSPTAAAESGASAGGDHLDLFGSMLSAAPENPIRKHPAPSSGDSGADAGFAAADGFTGANATSEGEKGSGGDDEGEWGVFEQPAAAEDRDPAPTLAAEKVDGEWIDVVVGPESDQPGEGKEGHEPAVDDEKDGDETAVSVGREEHEPPLGIQQQQQQQQQPGDNDSGDLQVNSDASVSATKAALGAASPPADEQPGMTPDATPDEEPQPADDGSGGETDPPNEGPGEQDSDTLPEPDSPAAATTPRTAEGGLLDDVGDFLAATGPAVVVTAGGSPEVPAAVSAAGSSEQEPSLPSVAVAEKTEAGGDEGNVSGAGEGAGPSLPGEAGVAAADILGWGDFGGPASADEAAADGAAAAAASPESADAVKPEGEADEDNEASRSASPEATGVAAVDVLGLGDFGGPAPATASSSATSAGNEREGHAKEGEEPSHSAAPDATGEAVADILDWGDFGGAAAAAAAAAAAVEATVDGAAAGSSHSADGNGSEEHAKEDEESSPSAVPGAAPSATGVAAADVLDWGDFGGPASAAEAKVGGAAAASAEGVDRNEQQGKAKEDEVLPGEKEEQGDDDEWSAFGAPPTLSAAQHEEVVEEEPVPRSADETLVSADLASQAAAASGVQEGSEHGCPNSRAPTTVTELGTGTPGVEKPAGNVGVEGQQPSEDVVLPSAAPAVEWGVWGEEEASQPSPEEPSAGRADADDKVPPGDDGEALPSAMPELTGGAGEDGSNGWGAFDEAPPAVASAVEEEASAAAMVAPADDVATESAEGPASAAAGVPAAAQAGEQVTEESPPSVSAAVEEEEVQAAVDGVATEEEEAPPAAVGAGADAVEVPESTGDSSGGGSGDAQEEPEESEDDWGSDFGDFEEAPTTDEPEPVASTASTAAPPAAVVAFPKPPVSAARSPPVVGPAVGAGGAAAAMVHSTSDTISGGAKVAADAGASRSPLVAMVAVFDGAFGGATAATAAGGGGSSLDSLADLVYLLDHAEPSRRRVPARLNEWAKSCILRGIRPVPDALSLQDDDDSDQKAGCGRVSFGFEAQPSSTPEVPSSRVSLAVEAGRPGATAAAERPASPSPLASSGRSPSAKASPRAVSPSSAPRPLPRKASTAVEPAPPRAEPAASPPAVLGQSATGTTATSRVVSPSSSPPPLPRKIFSTVEPPPTAPVAGHPADARSDRSKDAVVVKGQASLEAKATAAATMTATTPAVIESEMAGAFAAFPASFKPASESATFDEDEFVWSEATAITPEMPRHPPPRVPLTPPGFGRGSRGVDDNEGIKNSSVDFRASAGGSSGDDGDKDVHAVAFSGDLADGAEVDAGGGGGGGDEDDWSDDPFDSFQSAPPASSLAPPPPPSRVREGSPLPATAATADRTSSPSAPAEASPWNLDFLMAAPATGGAGEGRVSPTPSAGSGAVGSSAGEGGQTGKPLDLVSQALAGFGIAASAAPGASQATGGDDVFMAFSEGGRASGDLSSSASIHGGVLGGGVGGLKGERDRVSSVDVADLLRATRLRGGGRRASRPAETLSAAAEARLSALPDLSYMLSKRIRFPMRVAEPLPATATGEGFL